LERLATLRPRRPSGRTPPPAPRPDKNAPDVDAADVPTDNEPEEKRKETGNEEAEEEEEEATEGTKEANETGEEEEEEKEEKETGEEEQEAKAEEEEKEEAGGAAEEDGDGAVVVCNIDKDGLPVPLVDRCNEFDVAERCADIMEKSDTRGAVVAVHNLVGYRIMKDKDVQRYVDAAHANGDVNSNLNCIDPVMDYLFHKRLIAHKACNLKKLKRKRQPMAHRNPLKYILDKFKPQRRAFWEKKMYIFVGRHRDTLVDMPIAIRHGLLYDPFELCPYTLTRRNIRRVLVDVKAVYILRFKALPKQCR
jgi:flagellar biosynthesis GTPase FlhF